MTRLTGAAILLLAFIQPAAASLDRPKSVDRPLNLKFVLPKDFPSEVTEVPAPDEVQLTAETEVLLDGKKCSYKDVPATASIARLELAADGKTVKRIEFHSKK